MKYIRINRYISRPRIYAERGTVYRYGSNISIRPSFYIPNLRQYVSKSHNACRETQMQQKGPESEMAADQGDEHVLYTCTYESAEPLLTPVFFTLVIL